MFSPQLDQIETSFSRKVRWIKKGIAIFFMIFLDILVYLFSRFEVAYPSGVSHFLEKLAFGSTQKFKDKDDILHR